MASLRSFIPIRFRILTGAAITIVAATQSSHAISMRDDTNWNVTTNANPYVAEGSSSLYDAVGFVQWTSTAAGNASFVGTGTLVQSATPGVFKFLTAAHNVDSEGVGNAPDGIIDALSFRIYFGANTAADGSTATGFVTVQAASVAVQPFWTIGDGAGLNKGSSRYDLAVMTFTTISGGLTGSLPAPMAVSFANPINQTGTMVGYGTWGNGLNFTANPADGVRRAGKNTIDVVGTPADNPANTGFTIQTDFDSPTGLGNSIGTNVPLALEASTGGGDSGGPLVAGGNVVGVLNGGFPGTGGALSQYGDRSIWASLTDTANQNFLIGAGVVPVPEPATAGLLALAGLALAVRRRR